MKKLLIIGIVFLFSLITVNAITNTTEDKAYWKFNETTTDLINSINLTQSGNPTYELGILDNSTFLDGTGDYWTTNSNPYEIDNNDVSISFWMNATDITPTNIESLIANRFDISGTDNKIAIKLDTTGVISINTKDTGAKNYLTNTSIISGWNHIVWTRNGANCKVYQNGILTSSINDCPSGDLDDNQNWVFGDIDSNDDFNGELDEIFITGYEMTQQNVTDLYNGGSPTTAQQWPFISILTPQIETNLTSFYISNNISIQLNTSSLVNMSYILDNGNETFICADCNNSIVNFTNLLDGQHNVTWISKNSDGNNTNVETFEINPFQYFRFNNSVTSSFVQNYNFGGYSSNGTYVSIPFNDLNIGNNTLTFTKNGFIQENFTFFLNISNQLNETFNVSPVTIYVEVFDSSTLAKIDFNVTIENSTDIVQFLNLNELNKTYNETPTGNVTFTFESVGYSTGTFVNTINPLTNLNFNVYLTRINLSEVILFTVKDFNTGLAIENVLVEAQQVINGSYITLQQSYTSSQGITYLLLNPSEVYKFIFTKTGYVITNVDSIPEVTSYTIKLTPDSSQFTYIDNVNYLFLPSNPIVYVGNSYNFTGIISGTSITETNFTITTNNGTVLYSSINNNPTGTTFIYNYLIPNSSNLNNIILNLEYLRDGQTQTFSKEYDVYTPINSTINQAIEFGQNQDDENKLIRWFIVMVTSLSFILLGSQFQATRDHISIILLLPIVIFMFIQWIPLLYGTIICVALILLYVGANKK